MVWPFSPKWFHHCQHFKWDLQLAEGSARQNESLPAALRSCYNSQTECCGFIGVCSGCWCFLHLNSCSLWSFCWELWICILHTVPVCPEGMDALIRKKFCFWKTLFLLDFADWDLLLKHEAFLRTFINIPDTVHVSRDSPITALLSPPRTAFPICAKALWKTTKSKYTGGQDIW